MCFSMWTMCLLCSKKNNHGGTENTEISINSKFQIQNSKSQTTAYVFFYVDYVPMWFKKK